MPTMKAVVIHEAGGPEVLKVESWPIPNPQTGEVIDQRQGIRAPQGCCLRDRNGRHG
jgi:D-arabinose 1-dehydrogenase-like Zn-dependent alcohol dehydrogenase